MVGSFYVIILSKEQEKTITSEYDFNECASGSSITEDDVLTDLSYPKED